MAQVSRERKIHVKVWFVFGRGGEVFNAYIYARARVRDLNEKTH